MTEEQGAQLLAEMAKLNSLIEGVGIVGGHVAWWAQGCFWVLLCSLFFAAVRWWRS